jgi:hypothetical protein
MSLGRVLPVVVPPSLEPVRGEGGEEVRKVVSGGNGGKMLKNKS